MSAVRRGRSGRTTAVLLVLGALACAGGAGTEPAEVVAPDLALGDLAGIRDRGRLRVLFPQRTQSGYLPREGFALDFEIDLVEAYARQLGVEPVLIRVEAREKMIPWLLEGRGDLIAGNLTVTSERKSAVHFTVPVATVREQLVARTDDPIVESEHLDGRRIAIRRSSSYWSTVVALQAMNSAVEIELVPETIDTEEIIHRVAIGDYDLTVADNNLVDATLSYRDDVVPVLDLTAERPIAWAVRPDSPELRESLDRFLTASQLKRRIPPVHVGDLDEIRERRVLRVLSWNSAATYFLWRGTLMGFEYDLAKEFAGRQGVRLEMVVPPAGADLLTWLEEGRGDIVAAALTPTAERVEAGAAFSRPYNFVEQVVVSRASEEPFADASRLSGRTFYVRRSSSYWGTLQALQADGIDLALRPAPEELPTEEIIARVATGEYDLTLSDSHILAIELTWRDDVQAALRLGEPLPLAWALRPSNPELLAAVNEYMNSIYRGLFYNMKYRQYFDNPSRRPSHRQSPAADAAFSPYDELVEQYAERYGFDWRLIVAQMFQESRFDPEASSFAGAEGLMQLLPRTAHELGFVDLHDPETAIHAGVKYMNWLRDRFDPELPVRDRLLFTLAAYNAGAGHVRDARRLAVRLGKNPDRWFDHVEEAMLLLSRRQYFSNATHGYCRCREPVNYVREVWMRYNAYVGALRAAS